MLEIASSPPSALLFDNSFKRQIIGVQRGPDAAKSHNMQSSSLYFPIWVDLWGAIDARKHLSRQFMKLDMSLPPAAGGRAIQLTPDHNIYLLPSSPLWHKSGTGFQDLWQMTGQVEWDWDKYVITRVNIKELKNYLHTKKSS